MYAFDSLSGVDYRGIHYASMAHAYYSTIIDSVDVKWYLINSTDTKELDIIRKNFTSFIHIPEEKRCLIIRDIISCKEKQDEDFKKFINDPHIDLESFSPEIKSYILYIRSRGRNEFFNG